ncbi:MAG: YkvA family protein [Rhabdaerophilum sp.]
MSERWQEPFSPAEMQALRRAARDEAGILREVLAMMRRLARSLPFAEDVLAAYCCVRDPATSSRVKLILLAALAYVVLPLDGVPDFIPILGFADDAAMLAAAISAVRGAITEGHRSDARTMLDEQLYS